MRKLLAVTIALAALLAVPSASAWRAFGAHWSGRTITYHNDAPGYTWSLRQAIRAWNTSGVGIRFVAVPRNRARLLIGERIQHDAFGDRLGLAHVVGRRDTLVRGEISIKDRLDGYVGAVVYAHELGHVLGLAHEDRGCAAMNSDLNGDHPFRCPAPPAGMWWCRLLTADDVRGAIHIYGGTYLRPTGPQFCAE